MSYLDFQSSIKNFILRLFKRRSSETSLRDTIEELIEEDECSEIQSIAENEREMLENVLNLRDINVEDIMVPRVEIKALPISTKIAELLLEFVETKKSTILIYQGNIDNIIGVVYLKDVVSLVSLNKPFNISLFIKDVLFVPPSMINLDLLLKMKASGIKIAVVVDEYGGVDGLVSFQDLIEEIIGDIEDASEIKRQKKKVIKNNDDTIIVDARATFQEINKYGNIKITPEDKTIDTIGGMLFSMTGTVPVRGELISSKDLEFEILDADVRKIKSLKIRKKR